MKEKIKRSPSINRPLIPLCSSKPVPISLQRRPCAYYRWYPRFKCWGAQCHARYQHAPPLEQSSKPLIWQALASAHLEWTWLFSDGEFYIVNASWDVKELVHDLARYVLEKIKPFNDSLKFWIGLSTCWQFHQGTLHRQKLSPQE